MTETPNTPAGNSASFGSGGVDLSQVDKSSPAPATTPTPAATAPAAPQELKTPDEIQNPTAYIKSMEERYQRLVDKRNEEVQGANDRIAKLEEQLKQFQFTQESSVKKEIEEVKQQLQQTLKEAEQSKLETLRVKVATEAGIPVQLSNRLQGHTLEELQADAAEMVKLLPKTPLVTPGATGFKNPTGASTSDLSWLTQRGTQGFGKGGVISGDE